MKRYMLIMLVGCCACTGRMDNSAEEASIKKLLDDETHFAAKGDSVNWASCWVHTDDASLTFTTPEGTETYGGFNHLAHEIRQLKPFDLELTRSNYHYVIGSDVAFVSFDQQDNWGGEPRKTKETRTLRKIKGEWKIVNVNVVDVASSESQQTGSFHMAVNKIPKNPKTGFNNLVGIGGGMSVAYLDIPAAADFTPLFEGLPNNMCSSPHWGYIIDGSIKLRYPGGKEETVNAGEVFYWPAPHTGVVDKQVKFIDFSPDSKYIPLMDHIAKKMATQKKVE